MNKLSSAAKNYIKPIAFLSILFLFSFINAKQSLAVELNPIDVSNMGKYQTTTDHYEYFQDPSLSLEIDAAVVSNKWRVTEPGVTNRGFTKNNSWMRFTLSNPSDKPIDVILEYVDPAVVKLDLYTKNTDLTTNSTKKYNSLNFTFNKPVSTRPVSHYRPAFPVAVDANSDLKIYIRVVPGNEFPMHSFTSMRIWEAQAFDLSSDKELSLMLILLCVEVFMGLATLILFAVMRKKIFLCYTFFAFTAASLFAALSGLWSYLLAQNHYEIWMVVFQIGLCQIAAFLFVREFLQTKDHLPKIDLFLQTIIAINIAGLLLILIGRPSFSRIIIDYTALAFVLLIPIGLTARKKGVPHALLFTVTWIIFIIGMAVASMRLRGYIDDSLFAQRLIYFGGLIEVSLLSTIIVFTVRRLQNEKDTLELTYRNNLQESANKLSVKVNEQTQLLKHAKIKAENEARIDILTGISNRRAFLETADQYIGRVKRSTKSILYLAIIDIDHFKKINDTYGHSAGDRVLQSVANTLKNTIREIDSVSRIGGEEFAVLMTSETQNGILELCERLRTAVKNSSAEFDKQKMQVTISIGLSAYKQSETLDQFMQKSDKALYLAKLEGRNRVVTLANDV